MVVCVVVRVFSGDAAVQVAEATGHSAGVCLGWNRLQCKRMRCLQSCSCAVCHPIQGRAHAGALYRCSVLIFVPVLHELTRSMLQ